MNKPYILPGRVQKPIYSRPYRDFSVVKQTTARNPVSNTENKVQYESIIPIIQKYIDKKLEPIIKQVQSNKEEILKIKQELSELKKT